MRIVLLRDYVKKNFPASPILDYAFEVEKITTKKKPNLILNVDGFIAVSFLDLFRSSGCFTREEADEYVEIGILNGIFVLGRSMGFIGKFLVLCNFMIAASFKGSLRKYTRSNFMKPSYRSSDLARI